jgi:hypothetical protein
MEKIAKIVVSVETDKMDVPTLITTAKGIKTTGDADVVDPPFTDAQLQTQAGDLADTHSKRQTNQSKSLTRQEEEQAETLKTSVSWVGRYVQQIANKVAKDTGSVPMGEAVVERCGFKLKKKAEKAPRGFEVVDSGPGWTRLRAKSVGKRGGYLWRFGKTTQKGVMPSGPLTTFFTLECDVIIYGEESGAIMGYQMASILPIGQKNTSGSSVSGSTEDSSMVLSAKAKKAAITIGIDPYNWTDFIYEIVK